VSSCATDLIFFALPCVGSLSTRSPPLKLRATSGSCCSLTEEKVIADTGIATAQGHTPPSLIIFIFPYVGFLSTHSPPPEQHIAGGYWSLLQLHIIFLQLTYTACLIFFLSNSNLHTKRPLNFQEDSKKNLEQTLSQHLSQFKNGQRQGITHNTLISFSNPQLI
jgi:hypothetical protein